MPLAGLGTAVETTAPGLGLLLTGRVLYGLAIGFAMHAAPAYIAETAPASKRGLLIRCSSSLCSVHLMRCSAFLYAGRKAGLPCKCVRAQALPAQTSHAFQPGLTFWPANTAMLAH